MNLSFSCFATSLFWVQCMWAPVTVVLRKPNLTDKGAKLCRSRGNMCCQTFLLFDRQLSRVSFLVVRSSVTEGGRGAIPYRDQAYPTLAQAQTSDVPSDSNNWKQNNKNSIRTTRPITLRSIALWSLFADFSFLCSLSVYCLRLAFWLSELDLNIRSPHFYLIIHTTVLHHCCPSQAQASLRWSISCVYLI